MPSELTTPISIHTGAPVSTSKISIDEITIRPTKGDIQGSISLVLSQGSGEDAFRIPGSFSIKNNSDSTLKEVVAGRYFDIPVGDFFDDVASSDPDGASMFEAVKVACYAALSARYPSLSGNVI
jgi:hypothetical protein